MLDQIDEQQRALPDGFELRGSYRIDRMLGAGGFAVTYLARHIGLDQLVAIKEYLPIDSGQRSDDGVSVLAKPGEQEAFRWGLDRFAEEARTLASFDHPGIVSVADIFECNGTAYMVMDYVAGEPLETRLRRDGVLDETALRGLLGPILDALQEIHARGILHRDIKPENIQIDESGKPVLLDFGNARNTQVNKAKGLTVMLTPGFAPAEQYSTSIKQGPWTDIYALGATLYLAVAGFEPPEAPDRAIEDGYQSAHEAAKPGFSRPLLSVIDRALALNPAQRPQNIVEFRRILDAPASPLNTLVPVQWSRAAKPRSTGPRKRSPLPMRLGGAIAAGLFSAVIVGSWYIAGSEVRRAEELRIATEQARIVAERTERETAQRRERQRWERAAAQAQVEMARRQALAQARQRAQQAARIRAAEDARRREAETARQRVQRENSRRQKAQRQLVQRQVKRDPLNGPGGLLGGVRRLFRGLVPPQ